MFNLSFIFDCTYASTEIATYCVLELNPNNRPQFFIYHASVGKCTNFWA